jgi:hypothetical protein
MPASFRSALLGPLLSGSLNMGGLQTDDPDFRDARQAVKKALILWLVLTVVHIAVLAKLS